MLSVSNEYLQAICADSRDMDYRVTLNGSTVLGKGNVTNMTFNESVSGSNGISLGTSNSASLNLTIRDAEPMDYNGVFVEPESGLTLPDGTVEWIPLGKFWVTNFDTKNDFKTLTLTCADGMYNLTGEYVSELEYPTTIQAVVNELVVKTGVKFVVPSSYPDVIVRRKPPKMSYRNAFGYAAGCCGKNARFNREGALEFVWYNDTGLSIEREAQYLDGMTKLGNKSLVANFNVKGAVEKYSVNIVTDENGYITATPYASILEGDMVALSVNANDGYELATIVAKTAGGVDVALRKDGEGGYAFVQPDSDVTVTASFRQNADGPFNISVMTDGNGTISTDVTVAEAGDTVTITVDPAANYTFNRFVVIPATLELTEIGTNTYTFTVPVSDVTITAYFNSASTYTIERIVDYQGRDYTPGYIVITNETRGGSTYYAGDSISVRFARTVGHVFGRYESNITLTPIDNDDFHFVMPAHNVSITAYFDLEVDADKEGAYSFLEHPSKATPPVEKPYWAVFYQMDTSVGANARYYLVWFDKWSVTGTQTIAGRTGYTVVMDGYYYCQGANNGLGSHTWDDSVWMGNGASGSTLSWGVTLSRWEDGYGLVATNNHLYRNGNLIFQKCDTAIGETQTSWLVGGVDMREAGAMTRYACPDTYSTPLPGAYWLVTNDARVYKTTEDGDYTSAYSSTVTAAMYFDSVTVENIGQHFSNIEDDYYKLTFPSLFVVPLFTGQEFSESPSSIEEECYIIIRDPNKSCSAGTSLGGASEHTCGLYGTNYTFSGALTFYNNSVVICDCEPTTFRLRSTIGVEAVDIEYTNPFIYEKAVDAVQGAIESIAYTPVKVKHRGNPALQAGDIVTVPDGDGSYHNVLIMSHTMTFGGGMNSELTCPGQTSKTASFNSDSHTSTMIDQKVDEATSNLENKLGVNNANALSAVYKSMTSTQKTINNNIAQTETRLYEAISNEHETTLKYKEELEKADLNLGGQITEVSNKQTTLEANVDGFRSEVSKSVENLQSQIDGNITTWTGAETPTLSNEPAINWTDDVTRNQHIGDLYYVESDGDTQGFCYRFQLNNGTYEWVLLKDSEITAAIQKADEAKRQAETNATRIEQTDQKIALEVVHNDDVITKINASKEGVQIDGDKVNIKGKVTFSSFDDSTQEKINTATTDANTAKTNASTALSTANTANNKINAVTTTENNTTVIDGGKIKTSSITADKIDVDELFAQEITIGPAGTLVRKSDPNIYDPPLIQLLASIGQNYLAKIKTKTGLWHIEVNPQTEPIEALRFSYAKDATPNRRRQICFLENGKIEADLVGNATSASKLTHSAGSSTYPIYFAEGIPQTCPHSLKKSVPEDAVFTDTTNTAGATNTSSKIYLIGATSQADNPQTYSHDTVYVGTDGHLYSNGVQVVNLNGSQALTNKTYNGYTLAAACAKGVTTSVASGNTNLVTSGGVYTALSAKQAKVVVLFDGSASNQLIQGQSVSINMSAYRSIRVYYHTPGSGGVKETHMMYKTGMNRYPDYYYDGIYAPTPDNVGTGTRIMCMLWGINEAKTTFTVRRCGWFDNPSSTWNERANSDYGVIRIEGVI